MRRRLRHAAALLCAMLLAPAAMAGTPVQNARNPLPIVVPPQPYVKPPFSTQASSAPTLPGSGYMPGEGGAQPEELAETTQAILSTCNMQGWQVRLSPGLGETVETHVELSPTLDDETMACVRGVIGAHDFKTDLPDAAAAADAAPAIVPDQPPRPPGG